MIQNSCLLWEFIIFSLLFCTFETFSNEKFKRKDCQSSLFSFHFSINMNSSEVVISETPLPGTLPQNELLKKQLPTLLSAANQPIFASPQSPILEHNLLQGGEIGRVSESTISGCNDTSLKIGS